MITAYLWFMLVFAAFGVVIRMFMPYELYRYSHNERAWRADAVFGALHVLALWHVIHHWGPVV